MGVAGVGGAAVVLSVAASFVRELRRSQRRAGRERKPWEV